MTALSNVFILPSWAQDPDMAPRYWSVLRRLVTEYSESVGTAQLLLENWHRLGALAAEPVATQAADPFRDFWPWYSEIAD